MPTGYEDDDYFHDMLPADKDFIDYWWRLLFRYLRQDQTMPGNPVEKAAVVFEDEYEAAEEEVHIAKDMEAAEKREAQSIAAEEFAALQESQASEDAAFAEKMDQEREARRFRDWEEWTLFKEMQQAPKRLRADEVKVQLKGFVDEACTQSMQWTMRANQTITTPSSTTSCATSTQGGNVTIVEPGSSGGPSRNDVGAGSQGGMPVLPGHHGGQQECGTERVEKVRVGRRETTACGLRGNPECEPLRQVDVAVSCGRSDGQEERETGRQDERTCVWS